MRLPWGGYSFGRGVIVLGGALLGCGSTKSSRAGKRKKVD